MARCTNCSKFTTVELADMEQPDLNVEVDTTVVPAEFTITGDATLTRTCDECGSDVEQATTSLELKATANLTAAQLEALSVYDIECKSSLTGEDRGSKHKKSQSRYAINGSIELFIQETLICEVTVNEEVDKSDFDEC